VKHRVLIQIILDVCISKLHIPVFIIAENQGEFEARSVDGSCTTINEAIFNNHNFLFLIYQSALESPDIQLEYNRIDTIIDFESIDMLSLDTTKTLMERFRDIKIIELRANLNNMNDIDVLSDKWICSLRECVTTPVTAVSEDPIHVIDISDLFERARDFELIGMD
jgi:hypothetical protein